MRSRTSASVKAVSEASSTSHRGYSTSLAKAGLGTGSLLQHSDAGVNGGNRVQYLEGHRVRQRIRRLKDRFPRADGVIWNVQRDLAGWPKPRGHAGLAHEPSVSSRYSTQSTPHVLVVVPASYGGSNTWGIGEGNIFYELVASLQDLIGPDNVQCVNVNANEPTREWHQRVRSMLASSGATHLLAHAEHEPSGSSSWSWDQLFDTLRGQWHGTPIALFMDSVHRRHVHFADRLARIIPSTCIVAIDRSLNGVVRPSTTAVGPVFLPVSRDSVQKVLAHTADVNKVYDVTFIGEMYPYRSRVIDELAAQGLAVTVNPHRGAGNARATYLDFVRKLAESRLTINFSLCSSLPLHQLKSRMLEVGLAGSVAISDESDLSGIYLRPGRDFLAASTSVALLHVARSALGNESERAAMEQSARTTCARLAPVSFWDVINTGLLANSKRGAVPLLSSPGALAQ